MDNNSKLILSHSDLLQVTKVLFEIIAERDLLGLLDEKLSVTDVKVGFVTRANEVEDLYARKRRSLYASGVHNQWEN